ncbi:MAG: undecaprenyl-diphosphate phosphatase [Isosphaeraceae bacterium]|nr:undecaprenyl-diphosphate phosphatase [Isosphaeraceae bacterium]
MDWIEALSLGVVQGLTEFLPVSSDGHLVLAQKAFGWWLGKKRNGAEDLFFDVMLHVGTLAAIFVHYRAVGRTGAKGLLGSDDVPPAYRRSAVVRVGILACVATLPLVPYALFFKHFVEQSMESLRVTGWGFIGTATALLLTTWLSRSEAGKGPSEMTWLDALLIGLAQMLAPLPGVSRSGLTVAAALALGLSRAWAVGFSLLIAIPAILGAAVFELKDIDPHVFSADRVARTLAAATVAGIVGYGAIRWLVKVVRAGHLWYFSVYLVVLAVGVLTLAPADVSAPGGSTHARRAQALDRPVRVGGARAGAASGQGRRVEPLDRAERSGPRAASARAGEDPPGGLRAPRLVLGRPVASRP